MTLTIEVISRLAALARQRCIQPIEANGGVYYTMTISRYALAQLVMEEAKARWKEEYRIERLLRRWV